MRKGEGEEGERRGRRRETEDGGWREEDRERDIYREGGREDNCVLKSIQNF